ncbi:MAG TPA: DUF5615 family PIN-like protein, partial [Thermoanaerobaculia bacterium]|nr:DUF5615 family PIN-like protein [Thermoanaerobaculia bacterium]
LGLRGHPDEEIFQFAVSRSLVLLTNDLGFGARARSISGCPGLVLVRLPNEWPTSAVNDWIEKALLGLPSEALSGSLIVVEPERIRIRQLR